MHVPVLRLPVGLPAWLLSGLPWELQHGVFGLDTMIHRCQLWDLPGPVLWATECEHTTPGCPRMPPPPPPPLCALVSPLVKRGTSNPFGKVLRHFCQGVPGHEGAGWVTLATVMTSLPTLGTALTWEFLSTHERGGGAVTPTAFRTCRC